MASVELRPGDTLSIIWSSIQKTPLGSQEVESSFIFTYDELLGRLQAKGKAGKSRRSGTEGARFSRVVALSVTCLRKGVWANGAAMDRGEVFKRLLEGLKELPDSEYGNLTDKAKSSLLEIYEARTPLRLTQKAQLKRILQAMGLLATGKRGA